MKKFRRVKGNTGQMGTWSFESTENEGHFLRH